MSAAPGVLAATDARGVATVTIDNTAKLNTLDTPIMDALIAALDGLAADPSLRAVVLRGAGERAFVGGADIREMAALDAAAATAFIGRVHGCCDAVRRLPVPVIARIRGHALGAGLELAASCDLRVAADDARFAMPEVRIGIPSVVEAALLPGLIGWGRANRLLLTGEAIDAAQALAWGLVEEVVPPDDLDAAVERLLAPILAAGPHAVRAQKALMQAWQELPMTQAIAAGIPAFQAAVATGEPARMMRGFLDAMAARRRG